MIYLRMIIVFSVIFLSILTAVGFPPAAQDPSGQGKLIVQEQCTKCHNLKRVKSLVGKLDMSGWTGMVNKMVSNGAKLSQAEKDAAVTFLSSASSSSALD